LKVPTAFFRACKSIKKQAKMVVFVEKLTKMGKIEQINTPNEDKIRWVIHGFRG
jgi:hypothetical protein